MQISKIPKQIIIIVSLVLILILGIVIYKNISSNQEKGFYYTFELDENKISQSVRIYNEKNKLQTKYYIYNKEIPVSYTKGEKAVVTIARLDLKDHPVIEVAFESEPEKKVEVRYKD